MEILQKFCGLKGQFLTLNVLNLYQLGKDTNFYKGLKKEFHFTDFAEEMDKQKGITALKWISGNFNEETDSIPIRQFYVTSNRVEIIVNGDSDSASRILNKIKPMINKNNKATIPWEDMFQINQTVMKVKLDGINSKDFFKDYFIEFGNKLGKSIIKDNDKKIKCDVHPHDIRVVMEMTMKVPPSEVKGLERAKLEAFEQLHPLLRINTDSPTEFESSIFTIETDTDSESLEKAIKELEEKVKH